MASSSQSHGADHTSGLSATSYDERYNNMPAMHLQQKTRNLLSRFLNVNLRGKDWRDVADEMEYDYLTICNWEQERDPMGCLLRDWQRDDKHTVGKLLSILRDLEREDVLRDVRRSLEKDLTVWLESQRNHPVQVNEVTESHPSTSYPNLPQTEELRGITLRDKPSGPIETFDAYVCFCEEDRDIVHTMMRVLEKPPYNLKLCVDFRDLVPGAAYVTATAELIRNRCKRMIIVLSPEFLESEACDFQAKVALTFSPGARMKRIVPIMYKRCVVPPILKHVTICNFTKVDLQEWFWERLYAALNLK
ncbi:myeloid differentiation primary response protein MyD88-like [Ptychodera flava]|uniref:myeloid differentiation primary response protein MyD88-like n=1 Tax=Ptychodera flava TaxID=63121 RepID=UPI00396A787C